MSRGAEGGRPTRPARARRAGRRRRRRRPRQPATEPLHARGVPGAGRRRRRAGRADRPAAPRPRPGGALRGPRQGGVRRRRRHVLPRHRRGAGSGGAGRRALGPAAPRGADGRGPAGAPVFAAHGLTLTAAFELSLACDILLAAEKASFGLVEIVVGLTPSMGGPQRLAERAGPARARELIFTGERYPADAGAVERRQPGAAGRRVRRGGPRLRPPGRRRADGRARRDQRLVVTAVREGARAADAWCPRSPARCSPPRTCAARSRRSLPTARGRRPTPVGDRGENPVPGARAGSIDRSAFLTPDQEGRVEGSRPTPPQASIRP